MVNVNIKTARKCAFCKYWYDPTNSAIEPIAPNIGTWCIVDTNMTKMCLKKNLKYPATSYCSKYECKIPK